MSEWISTKETTRMLGVAPTTLRRWADEGKLVCQRTAGGHRRFLRSSIESFQRIGIEPSVDAAELREWVAFLQNNDVHHVRQRLNKLYAQSEDWFAVADFLGSVSVEVGELWIVCIPGELYPEIAVGGIVNPEGADYEIEPVEVPPLRTVMRGRVNMMVNLANDALGYIIPKSEWDNRSPWLYGAEEMTSGEIVSAGPETAPLLHQALLDLLTEP